MASVLTLGFETYLGNLEQTPVYTNFGSVSTQENETDTFEEQLSLIDNSTSLRVVREKEWFDLVGKDSFLSLDVSLREFLINTAGVLDFGGAIDIQKIYEFPPYEEE